MTTTLSTKQRLLTKAVKRLAATLENNGDWATATLQPPAEDHERKTYVKTERSRIRKTKSPCTERTSRAPRETFGRVVIHCVAAPTKRENIDNSFLQDQLLGKFTEGIQRNVLRAKEQRPQNDNWDATTLLNCAKDYIRTELKIVIRVGKKRDPQPAHEQAADRRSPPSGRSIVSSSERQYSCFYCSKKDHSAKDCTEVVTREERYAFMRRRNMCLNCGSTEHWAVQCKGGSCRLCKLHGHHTSLCPQLFSSSRKPSTTHEPKKSPTPSKATPKF
ncbi:zinc knuckle [Cooperia oncophora]